MANNTEPTGGSARYNAPNGIAVDVNNDCAYLADTANNVIRKIDPLNVVTTFAGVAGVAGSADGAGPSAQFSAPWGVAVDGGGNVYVADTGNHTIRRITASGIVTTIAGTPGNPGSADGTGASASFNGPRALAVDGAGSVYVADGGNDTIRKISPAGVVTTLAGTPGLKGASDGLGAAALFASPGGIAVDASGNIFVADTGNDTIRIVSSSGAVTTVAGTAGMAGSADGVGSAALFSGPRGIAVDSFENVVVADTGSDTIRAFSGVPGQAVVITVAGQPGVAGSADGSGGAALFSSPGAVAVGSYGSFFVADTGNDTVRVSSEVDPPVTVTMFPSSQAVVAGGFFAFWASVNANLPRVQWQLNGVDIPGATSTTLVISNVQFSDAGVYSVVVYDGTRKIGTSFATLTVNAPISFSAKTIFSGINGGPNGIAVDAVGNIYVTAGDAVEQLSPAGVVTVVAGSPTLAGSADGAGTAARFDAPTGLATDAQGNLYVADSGNNSIRIVTPGGVVTTLAGSTPGSADGLGLAAQFNDPAALAVDPAGNVYVVDAGNNELREIAPGGATTTILSTDAITNLTWIEAPYQISGVALDGMGAPQALAGNSPGPKNGVQEIPFSLLFHPNAPSSDPWETQFFWETGGTPLPGSMASDTKGNTYVAYDGQVWLRDPDYSWYQQSIGTYNFGGFNIEGTGGITLACGPVGTVYVADPIRQSVTAFSAAGNFTFATPPPLPAPVMAPSISPLSYPPAVAAPMVPSTPSAPVTAMAPSQGTSSPPAGGSTGVASPARLANISSRAFVGTDSNVEIGGFVVSGAPGSTERVLVRGVGPALGQFGVAGCLARPVLKLFDSAGNLVAGNTGWDTSANSSDIAAATKAVGAFPLPQGGNDSALVIGLAPGSYTAVVEGLNGATGVALAEVYEMDSGAPRLVNISTRAFVGAGSSVEIAGIVISGSQPASILVRAVGPALSRFGVAGALARPSLSVVDSSGNTVAMNSGWSANADAAKIASTTAAVGGFALDGGSADCAVLITLPPGAYTAVVSGVGGTSGVALIEAYQAP